MDAAAFNPSETDNIKQFMAKLYIVFYGSTMPFWKIHLLSTAQRLHILVILLDVARQQQKPIQIESIFIRKVRDSWRKNCNDFLPEISANSGGKKN